MLSLGQKVDRVRRLRGLGVNELDRVAGLPKGETSRIISGERQRPNAHNVRALAKALEVEYDWLQFDDGAPPAGISLDEGMPEDGMSLEDTVKAFPDRWSPRTVAAAAGAFAGGRPENGFKKLLDDLQAVVDPGWKPRHP